MGTGTSRPFFLPTFSTHNILRKTIHLYKGKNIAVTTHTVSNAKFTNLRSAIRSGHAANTSGGEFRSHVLQVFAPARSYT
jgi:hypothetical protein